MQLQEFDQDPGWLQWEEMSSGDRPRPRTKKGGREQVTHCVSPLCATGAVVPGGWQQVNKQGAKRVMRRGHTSLARASDFPSVT